MASTDWTNPAGTPFRFDKTIEADPKQQRPNYPAVISIWGRDARDEAERFAELVEFLRAQRRHRRLQYQVALLLHSVRDDHSGACLAALGVRGIPAFCPRARAYLRTSSSADGRLLCRALRLAR